MTFVPHIPSWPCLYLGMVTGEFDFSGLFCFVLGITPAGLGIPYGVSEIEPGVATCRVRALPAVHWRVFKQSLRSLVISSLRTSVCSLEYRYSSYNHNTVVLLCRINFLMQFNIFVYLKTFNWWFISIRIWIMHHIWQFGLTCLILNSLSSCLLLKKFQWLLKILHLVLSNECPPI